MGRVKLTKLVELAASVLILLATLVGAAAQTPPSATTTAQYAGLHAAAWQDDTAAIRNLGANGADPNEVDNYDRTPLHVAAFASNEQAMRALIQLGANPNRLEDGRYDIVTIAAVVDDAEFVRVAIELGCDPGNITSIYDGTALIAAAHLGHYKVVEVLIEAGAPLDHINNLHWTALMEAVVLGDGGVRHIRTVAALVKGGADTSITDRSGRTPLDHARQRGYQAIIDLIEEAYSE